MKHRNVHLTLLNSAHFYWIFKPDLVTAIFILINKCYCSWDIGWDCTFCCTSDSLSCAQTISFPFWIFKFLRHTTLNSKKLQRKKVTFAFHNNIHILKFASSSLSSLPSSPLPLSNVLLMQNNRPHAPPMSYQKREIRESTSNTPSPADLSML